jgi:predicted metal-dependent peptidase
MEVTTNMRNEFTLVDEFDDFEMDTCIAKLYNSCPFLGYIFSSMKRIEDNRVETICVTETNTMLYNKQFMASLTMEWCKYVLLHECMHKINEHFKRGNSYCMNSHGKSLKNMLKEDPKIMHDFNIAMDISVNQICDKQFERPPFGIHIEEISEKIRKTLDKDREWEYYYQILQESETEDITDMDHSNHIDTDGEPQDSEPQDGDELNSFEEAFDAILQRAIESQQEWDDQHGVSGSDSILSDIPLKDVKIRDRKLWKGVIGTAVGHNRIRDKEFTIRRPNRRDERNPIGRVFKKRNNKCIVIVDTSGSCMDYIGTFFSIINRAIKRHKTKVDLILCTTNVYNVYNDLSILDMNKIECKIGGTDLRKAQEYVSSTYPREGKGMNVIMITDGFTPWYEDYKYDMSVIYTPFHEKLKNIKHHAVMEE